MGKRGRKGKEYWDRQRDYQRQVFEYCKQHGQVEVREFLCVGYALHDGTKVMWRDGFHITFPDGTGKGELSSEEAYELLVKPRS